MTKLLSDDDIDSMGGSKQLLSDDDIDKIEEKPGYLESGISSVASGLTFGHSDEMIGAGRAAAAKIAGAPEPYGQLYDKYRDEQRGHQQRNRNENPLTYMAGETVGSAVTGTAIPMFNPAAATGVKGALARGALAGAVIGEGDSNAPLASPETLLNAGTGAAIAGPLGALGKALPQLSPSNLRTAAERKAVQAAGGMTREMRELGTPGVKEVGRELLDKKIISLGASLEDIANATGKARESAGQEIGSALGKVDDLVNSAHELIDAGHLMPNATAAEKAAAKDAFQKEFQFSGERIADRIEKGLIEPNRNPKTGKLNPVLADEFGKLQRVADNFREYGTTSLRQGGEIKTAQGAKTRFPSESVPEAFKKQVYGILKDELEDAIEKTSQLEMNVGAKNSGEALSGYKAAKKTYGNMARAEDMAEKSLGRQRSNRTVGLTDYLAGIAGVHAGGPVAGVALGAVNKAVRAYGDNAAALGLDKLANIIDKSPDIMKPWTKILTDAANRGGASLAITHHLLMKNDPDYARTMGEHQ